LTGDSCVAGHGSVERELAPPLIVEVLGTVCSLQTANATLRAKLAREWSRCVVHKPDSRTAHPLVINEAPTVEATGYSLASRLTGIGIRALRGQRVILHAAGLAADDGSVLALVAPSGQGKTTAAVRLAQQGLGYVTDETVAVDAKGSIVQYPKPLSFVDDGAVGGPKTQHSPDDLGMKVPPPDLRLARLVLINRVPGHAGSPVLERKPLVDGLLDIIPQSSSLARLETPLQTLCRLADLAGGIHQLTYSEIDDAIPLLVELLPRREALRSQPEWEAVGQRHLNQDDMTWGLRDGTIRRKPITDAIAVGDEALLMIADMPIRLSGLGRTIWDVCAVGATAAEVVAAAVATHGDHPDADRLVAGAVQELCDAGVLAWDVPASLADVLAGRHG
jgi:hypothetical protein